MSEYAKRCLTTGTRKGQTFETRSLGGTFFNWRKPNIDTSTLIPDKFRTSPTLVCQQRTAQGPFRTRTHGNTAQTELRHQVIRNELWKLLNNPSATISSYRCSRQYRNCIRSKRPTQARYHHSSTTQRTVVSQYKCHIRR